MSTTEHTAILQGTKNADFKTYARKNNFFYNKSNDKDEKLKGIDALFGIGKEKGPDGGDTKIRSIRFKADRWTEEAAREWLKGYDFIVKKFEPAEPIKEDGEGAPTPAPANTTSSMGALYGFRPKAFQTVSRWNKYKAPSTKKDMGFLESMQEFNSKKLI